MITPDTRWVLVLGMHRSGTSCLAGMLGACGAYLGDAATWSPHNAKGNRELERVWQLNDAVLASNGSSWDRPPSSIRVTGEHRRERDLILEGLGAGRPKVACIKDPRLLFTLPLWLEALPSTTRVIASIREPSCVAQSLMLRNGMSRTAALAVWQAYNTRLLALGDQGVGRMIDFSLPTKDYLARAQELVEWLGLSWTTSATEFFDNTLRHHPGRGVAVDTTYQDLYDQLQQRFAPPKRS